ncbi:NAD(P)-binding protein [Colletotrichum zoysiae]|uniref:NAD(P)-binding protein n=1 Tax=Colletotrichum zoysiae TaxID=1216348 RepID=A0AAD9HF02_9PEZI|nr:NAD(P)-binding protein [Colletotrichum zoysiae]
MAETVLVFGASGNVGIAAIIGALSSNRQVLAIVRNQASAEKIFRFVGSRNKITIVEADITSEDSVRGVIQQVRRGELPSFQHVWASPGGLAWETPTLDLRLSELREMMTVNFETYLIAYKATIPYLIEEGFPHSTWTMCTGGAGDMGYRLAPAVTQGALYSFAITAARENEKTNIRFNEVYLAHRVRLEIDEDNQIVAGMQIPLTSSKDFAPLYEKILDRSDIRSSRVKARGPEDVAEICHATVLRQLSEL